MTFKLEKLLVDVFAPQSGDTVTIMYDLPHGVLADNDEWRARRQMADDWHQQIETFSQRYAIQVHPITTYSATGSHHASLPQHGVCEGQLIELEKIIKKTDKEALLEMLKEYNFILCSTTELESDFETITLNTDSKLYDQNEILTIDDYVKFIVNSFQYKFPDTELSKKLGISRKSLWEKRKKYGLFKKK